MAISQIRSGLVPFSPSLLHPKHKKTLEKFFAEHFKGTFTKNSPHEVRIEPIRGDFKIQIGSQQKNLGSLKGSKKIARIFEYYQHLGCLFKKEFPINRKILSFHEGKSAVRAIDEATIPGVSGSMYAGTQLTDHALSVIQNFMYAVPVFDSKRLIADHLGYYGGAFWTFFGLREMDDGMTELKRSHYIKDKEGITRAKLRIVSGATVSTGAAAFLGGRIARSFSSSQVARAMQGASSSLFAIGSLLSAGSSCLGILRCHTFSQRMNEYLSNSAFSEKERLKGTLEFLKDSLFVKESELRDMMERIDAAPLSIEQKQKLLQKSIADLAETKAKYVKRRTGVKSLCFLAERVHSILEKISNVKTEKEGILEAKELIALIQIENRVKKILHGLGALAALVSLVAMSLMLFNIGGAIPLLLYGATALVYLTMTVYWVGCMIVRQGQRYIEAAKQRRIQTQLNLSKQT